MSKTAHTLEPIKGEAGRQLSAHPFDCLMLHSHITGSIGGVRLIAIQILGEGSLAPKVRIICTTIC